MPLAVHGVVVAIACSCQQLLVQLQEIRLVGLIALIGLAQRLAGNQLVDHFLLLGNGFQALLDLLLVAFDLDQGACVAMPASWRRSRLYSERMEAAL
jgi:hypothetical protein